MFTHPRRYWTSRGCVQAVIIVTLAILSLLFPVNANDHTYVNLLMALNLTSNAPFYGGTSPHVYSMRSDRADLIVPSMDFQRALNALRRSNDITLLTTFQQDPDSAGSIISLSDNDTVYLGLQVSSHKRELRLKYVDVDGLQRSEIFDTRKLLVDNTLHKLAVSISGSEVQVFYDCHSIFKRPLERMPDRNFSASNMTLFVGQERLDRNFIFKGRLSEAAIVAGPNGQVLQCPNLMLDSHCPTCGQFRHLQNSIELLQQSVYDLTLRLQQTELRLASVPSCECSKHCIVNGVAKVDGEIWPSPNNTCEDCTCTNGEISCYKRSCPKLGCKFPADPNPRNGECCPYCLRNCSLFSADYEHGEVKYIGCLKWECNDGIMNSTSICPPLSCPESEQRLVADTCCKFCEGEDYCAKGHACHTNATCLNLNTKYTCTCRPGFHGDGFHCEDVDECAQKGGTSGNHCHSNTRCVNTSGSYICECLSGYRRVDKFNCVEINECDTGQHTCHENAICLNTQGSYECRCKDGYSGDGFTCEPVCKHRCLNGGKCVAPDLCSCIVGFIGTACEQDLDECTTGLHGCHNTTTQCINMPGWYYCRCKPGYKSENLHGTQCVDIDECFHNVHSCHERASCVNTDGHFVCHCPSTEEDPDCRLSCMFEGIEIPDGGQITPHNQPCKICSCDKGVISCREKPCDCNRVGRGSDMCCPQCRPQQTCTHQELKHVQFKSGEQWIYRCQTCECLYGEYDCWKLECPPLTCDNPLPLEPGDCCPRCDNDPCNFFGFPRGNSSSTTSSVVGHPCTYKGNSIASGQSFDDPSSRCTTCACKDGRLYCNFGGDCFGDKTHHRLDPPCAKPPVGLGSTSSNHDHHPAPQATATEEKQPVVNIVADRQPTPTVEERVTGPPVTSTAPPKTSASPAEEGGRERTLSPTAPAAASSSSSPTSVTIATRRTTNEADTTTPHPHVRPAAPKQIMSPLAPTTRLRLAAPPRRPPG